MKIPAPLATALLLALVFAHPAYAQDDWVKTGTNLGAQRIRLAAADFRPGGSDPDTSSLKTSFDQTFYSDLQNAGIFDMVSKSMAPPLMPSSQQDAQLSAWAAAPSSAEMVAFGTLSDSGGKLSVTGYLDDTKNPQSPQVLGKQYSDSASPENARRIAHRFADEIIARLGGGINGIAETTIYYVCAKGTKEICAMDYDGQGQRQITHLGSISLSPRVSADNSRLAFASLGKQGWSIRVYSLELGRQVAFNSPAGTTLSPAWSSDGAKLAFSSDRAGGDSEIFTSDTSGGNAHRLEPQDQRADCLVQRPHGAAADLHHGFRWRERAAHDRRRLCDLAIMVTERPVSCLRVEPQVRPRRARRPGHLHHGHRQPPLDAADPRCRPQRLPLVGARRPPHCLSA
jgi:TolB protein